MKKFLFLGMMTVLAALMLTGCGLPRVGDQLNGEECERLYARFTEVDANTSLYDTALENGTGGNLSAAGAPNRSVSRAALANARQQLHGRFTSVRAPEDWLGPDGDGWYTRTITTEESTLVIRLRHFAAERKTEYDAVLTFTDAPETVVEYDGFLITDELDNPVSGSMANALVTSEDGSSLTIGGRFSFTDLQVVFLTDPQFIAAHDGVNKLMVGTFDYFLTFKLNGLGYDNYNFAHFTSSVSTDAQDRQVLNLSGSYDNDFNPSTPRATFVVNDWPLFI